MADEPMDETSEQPMQEAMSSVAQEVPPGVRQMSLTEAVGVMQQAAHFVRHLAQIHDAGFAIMQAHQGNEDLMRTRMQLEGDIGRLRDAMQTLTADLERDRAQYEAEQRRTRQEMQEFSRQVSVERAQLSQEYDQWKANLEQMRAMEAKEHNEALEAMNSERRESEQQLTAVRQELQALRQRLQATMG